MRKNVNVVLGFILCFMVIMVGMPVNAGNIEWNEKEYDFLEDATGAYQISGFMGMDDFTLYTLRQGKLINSQGYAYCQCIALSFQYDSKSGFTGVDWKDVWISDSENAAIVMPVSGERTYLDCGDFIECNDILYCVVAFGDSGLPEMKFYYLVEDAFGYVPWDAFLKTGASVSPLLDEGKAGVSENITVEDIKEYYKKSVFVGDSIIYGLAKYKSGEMSAFLEGMEFLAVGGYSSNNALKSASGDNLHPVYRGKKRQVWESIAMIQPEKIFISLGINDLNISGVEGSIEKYKQVIAKIRENVPDAQIHLVSITYVQEGAEKGLLNNDTIRQYNQRLQSLALENKWGYMDVATPLSDGKGNLAKEYCSDGFVHQSKAAYQQVWSQVLWEYASVQMEN